MAEVTDLRERRVERDVHARGAGNKGGKARTEVLWVKP